MLGLAVILVAASDAQAQTYYYYYPSSTPTAPTTTVATPGYAPQYYHRTWFGRRVYRMTYAPQSYETTYATQATQPAVPAQTAQAPTATQYIETSYVAPATETPAADAKPADAKPADAKGAEAAKDSPPTTDPYGFTNWLNATRAAYGLAAVGYDPNLSSWAASNNEQQAARGMGHFVMGPALRQNAAMGGYPGVETMWMNSPAHRAALLDPTIRWIGIAGLGAYWTFNAY